MAVPASDNSCAAWCLRREREVGLELGKARAPVTERKEKLSNDAGDHVEARQAIGQLAGFEPQNAGLRQRAHAVVCCGGGGGLARSAGGSTALLQVAPQTVSKALPLSSHCIVGVGVMYRTKARCRSN
jgi:hypothetical protein